METARIAQVLDEMGTILEIQGENPFRCRAYHNAAQALMNLPADLGEMIADGSLADVPGIGETMHAKIVQLATTGQLPAFDKLRKAIPPGILALLRIPGLGPKKIKALREALKIESLADLRAAAEAGAIAKLKGFGAKTEANILEGIAFLETTGGRILQHEALLLVAPDPRAGPGAFPGDPGRGLRQPAAAGRDDRRSRHPLQRHGSGPGPQGFRGTAPGREGPGARGRPRPACSCRRSSPTSSSSATSAAWRIASSPSRCTTSRARRRTTSRFASEPWRAGSGSTSMPWQARRARLPAAPRPTCSRRSGWRRSLPSCARTPGRSRQRRRESLPELVTLEDLTGTFHCHTALSDGGSDGENTLAEMAEARAGGGIDVPGHRRSLAVAPDGRRADDRAGARAVGPDRCAQQVAGPRVPALQGNRVRHPGRRLAGLSRRGARGVSTTWWPASTPTSGCRGRR